MEERRTSGGSAYRRVSVLLLIIIRGVGLHLESFRRNIDAFGDTNPAKIIIILNYREASIVRTLE